jgi:hypothetical protein
LKKPKLGPKECKSLIKIFLFLDILLYIKFKFLFNTVFFHIAIESKINKNTLALIIKFLKKFEKGNTLRIVLRISQGKTKKEDIFMRYIILFTLSICDNTQVYKEEPGTTYKSERVK